MNIVTKGTAITVSAVVAYVIPLTVAWSKMDARIDLKADKEQVVKYLHRIDKRLYRMELRSGVKSPEPIEPDDEIE